MQLDTPAGVQMEAGLRRPAVSPWIRRWLQNFLFPWNRESKRFFQALNGNFDKCDWQPDSEYSVFTQYDGATYYLPQREGFMRKYRWMYAVAKTIDPRRIVELGTHAGSSADAYLSASRSNRDGNSSNCEYIGIDVFAIQEARHWRPLEIAERLFSKRRFANFKFVTADLRTLTRLEPADMVVVDAAHDVTNALEDMKLALTANPGFVFVDDINGSDVLTAWTLFYEAYGERIAWFCKVDYPDGGLVVRIKSPSQVGSHRPPGRIRRFWRRTFAGAVAG
jgi:predicted O-methyltransferase YrrM